VRQWTRRFSKNHHITADFFHFSISKPKIS